MRVWKISLGILLGAALIWPVAVTARDLRVLQLNVWKSCNGIPGGIEALADEIVRSEADLVSLNEIVSTQTNPIHDRLAEALRARGRDYHITRQQESDILSLTPLDDVRLIYPVEGVEGRGRAVRATTVVDGDTIVFYTMHLDYLNDAYYNVRGIDGSTWKPCEIPATVDEVLARSDMSWRDDAVRLFIADAEAEVRAGRSVIMCGDFNEPSHLDWTEATARLYDHHGFVVPWTCTTLLDQAGYRDAYREVYPDPVTHPGLTFPASCESVEVKDLAWAPDADERDRIDYVFCHGSSPLKPVGATLVGPDATICRSVRTAHHASDPILTPLGVWPTDHRGVLVTFRK